MCFSNLRFILPAAVSILLISQMPDWRFFRDGDGNTYYVDNIGKIRTSGEPEFSYKVISARGLEYYNSQAEELILRHHPVDGLLLLKSILAMPPENQRIIDAQKRAALALQSFERREGTRYSELDRKASPLMYKTGGVTTVLNDVLFYSLKTPLAVSVIKNRWRQKYRYLYNGLTLGLGRKRSADGKSSAAAYEFLVAIDTEQFAMPVTQLDHLVKSWDNRLLFENIRRNRISGDEKSVIYSYTGGTEPLFAGFESFVVNGNFGYFIRTVTPQSRFDENRESMEKLVRGFRVSAQR